MRRTNEGLIGTVLSRIASTGSAATTIGGLKSKDLRAPRVGSSGDAKRQQSQSDIPSAIEHDSQQTLDDVSAPSTWHKNTIISENNTVVATGLMSFLKSYNIISLAVPQ